MSLADRWTGTLNDLHTCGRYRTLALPDGIDVCSNDYLGYASSHGESKSSQSADGTRTLGAADAELLARRSGTAARLLRGQHRIWEEVETTLARWHGAEACLMMSSGYAANEGLLSTVIQPDDWVASDQSNHASIIDGLRLSRATRFVYRHVDLNHLEQGLRAASATRREYGELFVATESLFGMDGDISPLSELVALSRRHGAHVIVDEAHATGCYGATGSGLVDQLGLRQQVTATVHTGGKALGVTGAYICGSALLRELLINRCRHFMFSTALPPAIGVWWRETIERVQLDVAGRSALYEAAKRFRQELARHGVAPGGTEYVAPVIVGSDECCEQVAAQLRCLGWDIRAIRPPTVAEGTARLRVSVHADHPAPMLAELAAAIATALESRL